MSIIQGVGSGEVSTGFYPFEIDQSCRFDDGSNDFLSRTFSAGNQKTFTYSCWVKLAALGTSRTLLARHDAGNNTFVFRFDDSNNLQVENFVSSYQLHLVTDAEFRDTGSWYNVVLRIDTTQSTDTDRARLYVNGTQQTSFSSAVYPSINTDLKVNAAASHIIGARSSSSFNFDGYLADVNFIDGQSLGPTSFGELKEDIWVPINTDSLDFASGVNSFRLQFQDSSSLGDDTGGETHDFSVTNLTSADQMSDSPTDNHATMNPLSNHFFSGTFSDGNLQIVPGSFTFATSTIGMTSGKYYAEVEFEANAAAQMLCGISRVEPVANGDNLGSKTGQIGYYNINGNKLVNGATAASYGATYTVGDIIGIAVNMDDGEIEFFKNNASQGTITGAIDTTKTYFFASGDFSSANNNTMIWNYGANAFTYTPPSGFVKLSTANLPDPAIDPAAGETPDEYWDSQLYTGNSGTKAISSFAFAPNWVWIKNRDNADNHYMYDSVRGVTKTIHPDDTAKEFTSANALQSFDSNGFTTGGDGGTNRNGQGYVAWGWKAGTSFSNDASATGIGTIDSTGTVSTEAGFSVISYTGTLANATVAHGLGTVPEWIIFKDLDNVNDWGVYHVGIGATHFLKLNDTLIATDDDTIFNDTAPTSSVISLGSANLANNSTNGGRMIAYCFAPKDGYSKFGQYEGNGNADGPFIYTGFRVAWLLIKNADFAEIWPMFDSKRDTFNLVENPLYSNLAATESAASSRGVDFLSNGFKIRGTDTSVNRSGDTHIYMAFADQPTKYANAR